MAGEKVWISDGGVFKPVKKLWVSDGGTFKESKKMFTSDGGTFKETSVFQSLRLLHTLAAWPGASPHADVNVSWNATLTGFNPDDPILDRVILRWQDIRTGESGKVESTNPIGQLLLVLPRADSEYTITLSARLLGAEVPLVTPTMAGPKITYRTNRPPAITNYAKWETHNAYGASWDVSPYVTQHTVLWLTPDTFQPVGWNYLGPGNGPGTRFDVSWPANQRTKYAYEIRALRNDSNSDPIRFTGTTGSLYTPGTYYVPPAQRRTWVKGNKAVKQGFNHPSEEFLWHGHGGTWNEYGTQIAVFYYWNDGSWVNPFQTILNALNNGAVCTKLEINVFREFAGYNSGRPVYAQTHGHKWVPNGDNLNLHDNLHVSQDKAWAENDMWIRLDPTIARLLCSTAGNGIALGNSNDNKDSYFNMFRKLSGNLRFTLV